MYSTLARHSLIGGVLVIATLALSGCVYYDPYDPYYAPAYRYRDYPPPRYDDRGGYYDRNPYPYNGGYYRDPYYRGY